MSQKLNVSFQRLVTEFLEPPPQDRLEEYQQLWANLLKALKSKQPLVSAPIARLLEVQFLSTFKRTELAGKLQKTHEHLRTGADDMTSAELAECFYSNSSPALHSWLLPL